MAFEPTILNLPLPMGVMVDLDAQAGTLTGLYDFLR